MFESKINRGKANGYAPLDGSGKVPLDKLPPIQSTINTGSFVTTTQTGSFITANQTGSFATTSSLQALINRTGSFATTGSNQFYGNQSISGSINISSSLVVSSTFVNNGTIDALNSDLIIDGGYLILTGSVVPTSISGSVGDVDGMVVFDSNFLYYCTTDYTLPITGSNPIFQITGSGTTHIYDIWEGEGWNGYHDPGVPRIQTGASQEDGGTLMPEVGWYMVDDLGSIKEIISSDFGFPVGMMPTTNGPGFLFEVDTDYVYSNANTTLTFYETIPTVNIITQAIPAVDGSGEIWTKTKLDKGPNYAPFGSGSWESQAIGEVTELDITKDIHLLDTTGNNNLYNWYLPDGLYDGHVVRFALKGDGDTNPSLVKIWMNNIRTYNGTIVSSTTWHPFYDDDFSSARSLATAVYVDGAWNIDTDYWDM